MAKGWNYYSHWSLEFFFSFSRFFSFTFNKISFVWPRSWWFNEGWLLDEFHIVLPPQIKSHETTVETTLTGVSLLWDGRDTKRLFHAWVDENSPQPPKTFAVWIVSVLISVLIVCARGIYLPSLFGFSKRVSFSMLYNRLTL